MQAAAVQNRPQNQNESSGFAGAMGGAAASNGAVPGGNRMEGVAETFDVFGNKVGGTSVRVHAPPGGKSSITF